MKRQHLSRTSQGDHQRRSLVASAQPMRPPEHPLRSLQRTIGNRAMGSFIQAKLKVSQPGDEYEQEADRIADHVEGMPGPETIGSSDGSPPSVQTKCDECESGGRSCPKCAAEGAMAQRRSLALPMTPVIQRARDACEAPREEESMSGPAEETSELPEEEESAQGQEGQEASRGRKQTESETPSVQRSSDGGLYASSDVTRMIESTKGDGRPLPGSVQRELGSKMGADFSGVRIHTDGNAVQLNRELASHAFTHGNDIYFNMGKYNPDSAEGKHLLAHELVHTVQQQAGSKSVQRLTVTPNGALFKGDCGNYRKRWIFELSAAAPEDGYIVQQVDLYEDIKDCPGFAVCLANPTLTFWEAWFVKKGDTLQHIHSSVGWTDQATRGPADKKTGDHAAIGEIKFYKKSVTGDLGKEDVLSSDPKSDWKPGTKGGVPLSGWLPSTKSKPSWWSSAPTEGPKNRRAYSAWRCCGSDRDFNIINAEP
jgi:Domain of unknown function (DUF4157)